MSVLGSEGYPTERQNNMNEQKFKEDDRVKIIPAKVTLAKDPEYYGQLESEKLTVHPSCIRTFDSGATRDTTQGKLDYVKALSSIVIRRYVQYLDKHRLQPDGSYRDFDNWKKGIPQETYHSSKARHFMASWLIEDGYNVSDNHGPVNEEDALCGEIFNAMGKLHEILKAKIDRTKPDLRMKP